MQEEPKNECMIYTNFYHFRLCLYSNLQFCIVVQMNLSLWVCGVLLLYGPSVDHTAKVYVSRLLFMAEIIFYIINVLKPSWKVWLLLLTLDALSDVSSHHFPPLVPLGSSVWKVNKCLSPALKGRTSIPLKDSWPVSHAQWPQFSSHFPQGANHFPTTM